jgi:hypothetical protein
MPALAASLKTCFTSEDQVSIVDVGGDPAGAHVLARYTKMITGRDYNMWMAVNANRPETETAEGAIKYMRAIEQASGLQVSGLINTTHMLRETTTEDILKGDRVVKDIAKKTGIQTVYTVINENLASHSGKLSLSGEVFPIKLLLLPDWL